MTTKTESLRQALSAEEEATKQSLTRHFKGIVICIKGTTERGEKEDAETLKAHLRTIVDKLEALGVDTANIG